MADLWEDEGFGSDGATDAEPGEDDWDEGEESIATSLEDEFDDPDDELDEDFDDDAAA
jgi:hypothetical protein